MEKSEKESPANHHSQQGLELIDFATTRIPPEGENVKSRIFDWLALGAILRGGRSWRRKRFSYVAWIKDNSAENTQVLHWVRFYEYGRGVFRLTNKSGGFPLPKSFWPHHSPKASQEFELSLLPEELLEMDTERFLDFVEWHNDPGETFLKLPLDFAKGFDGLRYSWTKAAWEHHKSGRSVSE